MSDPQPRPATRRTVDEAALRRHARRLALAPQPPWLHAEIARRMAERLPIIRLQPAVVLDWWAHAGGSGDALKAAYPKARIAAVEQAAAGPLPWWSPRRWVGPTPMAEADVPPQACELVWANMMLHAVADPAAVFGQWHRALSVGGFLMFSTLGPGTLRALVGLYAEAGWPPPMAPFVDMHDLGDMLVQGGFADPVMDQEVITLTWAGAEQALTELRTLGGNADPQRFAGLRTSHWRDRLMAALNSRTGADGRVALSFEVVYGHALKPAPRAALQSETRIGLDDMKAMVRSGQAPR